MTPAHATTEPCADPNNLTTQLATILRESLGIKPKGQGLVYQKTYSDYYDQLPYPRVIECLSFLSLVGRMENPHYSMLVNLFYNVVRLVLMTH
jgi:hypothetical protein